MKSAKHQTSVFVPIYNGTYFNSLFKLALSLNQISGMNFVFYFGRDYPNQIRHFALLENKFSYLIASSQAPTSFRRTKVGSLISRWHFVDEILNFIELSLQHRLLATDFRKIMQLEKISLCILPADNRYLYPFISKLSRLHKVPVIVIPQWFAGPKEIEESLSHSSIYKPNIFERKIIELLAPEYLRKVSNLRSSRVMIPIRVSEIILSVITKTIPPQPWILHSGYSDRIFVETLNAHKFAQSLGFDEKQLVLTGSPYLDEINLVKKSSNPPIRMLVAIAPDMFRSRQHAELDFGTYNEYLAFILSALTDAGFPDAILSMHPSDLGDFDELINSFGFRVSAEPLHLLLARAEIFLATISATIQWADYLEVPTVNFDFYHYNYPDYLGYSNVITVLDKTGLGEAIAKARKMTENRHVLSAEGHMISEEKEFACSLKILYEIEDLLRG